MGVDDAEVSRRRPHTCVLLAVERKGKECGQAKSCQSETLDRRSAVVALTTRLTFWVGRVELSVGKRKRKREPRCRHRRALNSEFCARRSGASQHLYIWIWESCSLFFSLSPAFFPFALPSFPSSPSRPCSPLFLLSTGTGRESEREKGTLCWVGRCSGRQVHALVFGYLDADS